MKNLMKLRIVDTDYDSDLLKILIVSEGENFKGDTEVFTLSHDLRSWGESLELFPVDINDSIEFFIGKIEDEFFFKCNIFVANLVGHCSCQITLKRTLSFPTNQSEYFSKIEIGIEPQAVSQFALEIKNLAIFKSGEACLEGVYRR